MTKTIRFSLAAAALGVLAMVAVPLVAQDTQGRLPHGGPQGGVLGGPGPGGPRGGPMGRGPMGHGPLGLLGDLGPALHRAGVTDDQQQQITQAMDAHRDEFQAIGDRMRTARESLRTSIEADVVDESAIRAKAADVATVEADLAVLGAKVRAEILGFLTPEQIQKVKAFRAEMQKRFEQGPRRRGF